MKNNILAEVNRVREIMGLDLLNEQIDVDDEIIVTPTTATTATTATTITSPYIKWQPDDGPAFYTLEEYKDKNITMKVGGYRYIGPFEPEGYTTLFTDMEEIEGEDFRLSVPVTPVIGGNMDIPFIEIFNRKSKPTGQAPHGLKYNMSEGAKFIGPQTEDWNFQNTSAGGSQNIYANIGEELRHIQGMQTTGQYRLLAYGQNTTQNKLAILITTIALREIDELEAMGKTEGKTQGKSGYLSIKNYIPRRRGMAWHLMGNMVLLPTAGIIDSSGTPSTGTTGTTIPDVITQDFNFRVNNPFEFDKAAITLEAQDALEKEMQALFELDDGEGDKLQQYIDKYLKGKEVIIYASSSIDANPEEIGGGQYVGTKNCAQRVNGQPTIKRKDYNLCLSQARAEAVAEYLKTTYPNIFGEAIFKSIGEGERESPNSVFANFGSAEQKAHSANNREATKEDRRFEFDLPGATFKDNIIQ